MRIAVRMRLTLARLREAGKRAAGGVAMEREVLQDFGLHAVAVKGGLPMASDEPGARSGARTTHVEKAHDDIEEN